MLSYIYTVASFAEVSVVSAEENFRGGRRAESYNCGLRNFAHAALIHFFRIREIQGDPKVLTHFQT
jgi:hypothetical protein